MSPASPSTVTASSLRAWDAAAELVVAHAPVVVGLVDTDERLVEVGGALLSQQSQWPGLVGRRVPDLLDDTVIIGLIRQALAGTGGAEITTVAHRPWIFATRPVRDDAGRVTGCAAMITYARVGAIQRELTASEAHNEQLLALIELSHDFIAVSGPDDALRYLNRAGRELVGLPETQDLEALRARDLFTTQALEHSEQFDEQLYRDGAWHGSTTLQHQQSHEPVPVTGDCYLVRRPVDGELLGIATVLRDLRPIRDANRARRAREAATRAVADLSRLALTCTVPELLDHAVRLSDELYPTLTTGILQLSPAGTRLEMLACSDRSHVGAHAPMAEHSLTARAVQSNTIVCSDDIAADPTFPAGTVAESFGRRSMLCVPITHSNGSWGVFGFSGDEPRHWNDDDRTFVTAMASTLGAAIRRQDLEQALQHQALHDPLTGLPNRTLLTDRIQHALELARRRASIVGVLLLDLDNFKVVNDDLGHDYGDQLLQHVAEHLVDAVPEGVTVARLGGDEFVLLCEDLADEREAGALAAQVVEACRAEIELAGRRISVAASVGVALSHAGEIDTEALISRADIAMYRAKRQRRATYCVFDEAMRGETVSRVSVAAQLRDTVRGGGLQAHYQPIVDLATGRVVGLEALARWCDEDGRAVPPKVFISVAEETGLIAELGAAMLRRSIHDAEGWRDLGAPEGVALRVNTTAHELRSRDFFAQVMDTLAETGYPVDLLGLEITESMLVEEDQVTQDNLAGLREAGVQLLVDDFGTGYSSLSYLSRFPVVDVLKVDRSFLAAGNRRGAVVEAVVALGRAFDLKVCAEGVETAEQHALVAGLGCDMAQGYHLARPVPADAVGDLLRHWTPRLP